MSNLQTKGGKNEKDLLGLQTSQKKQCCREASAVLHKTLHSGISRPGTPVVSALSRLSGEEK